MVRLHPESVVRTVARLHRLLDEHSQTRIEVGVVPTAGSELRIEFEECQRLANWAGVGLTPINGLGVGTVMTLLSGIGADLGRFASVKHFCSWLGPCPGMKISGGKVLSSGGEASGQPGKAGVEDGGHGPLAQRFGTWRVLPAAVYPYGQAARQYGGGPQTRVHGVPHAHLR
ncbi:hypothetical protein BZL54_00890 [Burkholderia ubonensis subsp. mesacidophila]|uniref:Transposase IS116/IS110/IS902 C-terminal domain-containing protein n=1 Tax=Burkholderia ubonensis subsp. mesacidophila TaxID=265293 RepID=A0A2A4FNB3_9BURK|nr:hypothetical protein BZL54_00890 [Burkholderia ubonensis subsp. mesacidophila]